MIDEGKNFPFNPIIIPVGIIVYIYHNYLSFLKWVLYIFFKLQYIYLFKKDLKTRIAITIYKKTHYPTYTIK